MSWEFNKNTLFNPHCPNSRYGDKMTEIFYFHTSFWGCKRKNLFEALQRKVKIKIMLFFISVSLECLGQEGLIKLFLVGFLYLKNGN